jgi:hypothetical protein
MALGKDGDRLSDRRIAHRRIGRVLSRLMLVSAGFA